MLILAIFIGALLKCKTDTKISALKKLLALALQITYNLLLNEPKPKEILHNKKG